MRTSRVSLACVAALLMLAAGCNRQSASSAPSDQQLTSNVQSKLQGESALAGQNIQVAVNGGVVTLSGTAADAASRALAGNEAGSIPGVKTVVNNLEVQPATTATSAPPATEPAPPAPTRERRRHDRHVSDAPDAAGPTMSQNVPPPSAAPAPAPQPAPVSAPPPPPRPVQKTITLAAGTVVPVRITESLNSESAQPDDTFHGTLAADLVRDGTVAIAQGTPVLGRVVEAKSAAHFKGSALLTLELTRIDMAANKMSVVTDPFSKEGAGRGKNTAEKAGGGAVLGTLIGALAGGGKGAAIGAIAGAGAGTGVNAATRGQQVQIPSETLINFTLQQPLSFTITVMPGSSNQRQPYEPTLNQRPPQ